MIIVATTTCAAYLDVPDRWASWMKDAQAIKDSYDGEVHYFAALELDARGIEPFAAFIDCLHAIGGSYFTFSLDDGRTSITTENRLRHITLGQNIVTDFCTSDINVSHLLFLAADTAPPIDIIPRMLEMNHPLCAPFITTYGLRGPAVEGYPYPVEDAIASAACIFIGREVFRRLRWRHDVDLGMSDDPSYQYDAATLLGIRTHVRMDCFALHYPECVGPIEGRLTDGRVVR